MQLCVSSGVMEMFLKSEQEDFDFNIFMRVILNFSIILCFTVIIWY